jgi:hypothetical protein
MAKNHENKVYAGGIRNRINRITLRTSGESTAHCNSNFTDQNDGASAIEPRSVISRTTKPDELEVQRSRIHEGNPPVKDNDV